MGHLPVTDLVAQAWIASLPGFSSQMVGAKIPQGTSWSSTGFIRVTPVAGEIDPYTGLRTPQVQVDCVAVKPGSAKPPWFAANQLAEKIVSATVSGTGQQTAVTLPSGYDPARIMTVRALGEPVRVRGDEGGYARYTLDLAITWVGGS